LLKDYTDLHGRTSVDVSENSLYSEILDYVMHRLEQKDIVDVAQKQPISMGKGLTVSTDLHGNG
jgi:hypothetical protein